MTIFTLIYYPYLIIIDSYMRMHFPNKIKRLVFLTNFESQNNLFFGTGGA